ncbi:hypothetical protein [Nitrosomonas sp. Nm33]|uniref:hypothetical protein n=1 Tax=Nitrosomonas sp. Nm33 TaxID=133724 RepID=UPI00089901C6|nr:hypothetical protein [Nitrosomonas sp. Nm33]SDY58216.1 hypothetical protein SAMN05421755_103127 [Nitrosomonas sp. Nm33]
MTDHSVISAKIDDDVWLNKLEVVLLRYRKKSSVMIHPKEAVLALPVSSRNAWDQAEKIQPLVEQRIPTLTEKRILTSAVWSLESDISFLLCYVFDAILREVKINLTPSGAIAALV